MREIRTAAGRALGLGLCLVLVHALVPASLDAMPRKDYREMQTTRCVYTTGCPRMLRAAISHARDFCRNEGGVRRGDVKRDFRCQQQGIYCVVTGVIECNGRIDPTLPPGGERPLAEWRTTTCLDATCDRYIDHAPGYAEQGVHACRPGFAMVGLSADGGDLVCQGVPSAHAETRVDVDGWRDDLRACPRGQYMIGASGDRSRLLCAAPEGGLGGEVVQTEPYAQGLQVCQDLDGRPAYLVGIDPARKRLLCASPAGE